jgi:hypothetical protein
VINWSPSATRYDYGSNPSISLYGNTVVAAHEGGNGSLYYRTGYLSNGQITWNNYNTAIQYDNGIHPSVSLQGDIVVEVHDGNNGKLWYIAGTLYNGQIYWANAPAVQYDWYENFGNGGYGTPSVSVYGNNVVEVHDGNNGNLYYHLGILY